MKHAFALAATCIISMGGAVYAQDNNMLVLGKSNYNKNCTNCHGSDAKGGGEIAGLFTETPPDLTKLAKQNGGSFPFSKAYNTIIMGMEKPGHGPFEMPVWGDYFMADALEDRGVNKSDAMNIAAGRAFSVALYLESIQE